MIIMESKMLYDSDHDISAITIIFSNYPYFYAFGIVIIMSLRHKVLMAYWQLILFPVASSLHWCIRPLNMIVSGTWEPTF